MIYLEKNFQDSPGAGTALSAVLLKERGEDSLFVYRPGREVVFSGQDCSSPNFNQALRVARSSGYTPIKRTCGGRAVVFHPDTLVFVQTLFHDNALRDTDKRFQETAALLQRIFAHFSLPLEIGEVPGEYCPGEWSLSLWGQKIAGIAQRITGRAAQVSTTIMLAGSEDANKVLEPLYSAFDLEFSKDATGEAGISFDKLAKALQEDFSAKQTDFNKDWSDELKSIIL